AGETLATPERLSAAEKLTVTSDRCQPSALAGGLAAAVSEGGVRSMRTSSGRRVVVPSEFVARHANVGTPSIVTVVGSQPALSSGPDRGVRTFQPTSTLVRSQPAALGGGASVAVTIGAGAIGISAGPFEGPPTKFDGSERSPSAFSARTKYSDCSAV